MRRGAYWLTIVVDVNGHVAKCAPSPNSRQQKQKHASKMRLFHATGPFENVALDILGRFPQSEIEYRYLLVMCDRFTKRTRAFPLRDITAIDVTSA